MHTKYTKESDPVRQTKFGRKFEVVSKLFDHAAHNGSNYLNGHCFVSLMLCVPVWNHKKVVYLAQILDRIGNARSDSIIYDLAPELTGRKGRPAKHRRRLSIETDFVLSDEKIGDYYPGVRRVLTNVFGSRQVMAYDAMTAH